MAAPPPPAGPKKTDQGVIRRPSDPQGTVDRRIKGRSVEDTTPPEVSSTDLRRIGIFRIVAIEQELVATPRLAAKHGKATGCKYEPLYTAHPMSLRNKLIRNETLDLASLNQIVMFGYFQQNDAQILGTRRRQEVVPHPDSKLG